jgi:hypothetical protein
MDRSILRTQVSTGNHERAPQNAKPGVAVQELVSVMHEKTRSEITYQFECTALWLAVASAIFPPFVATSSAGADQFAHREQLGIRAGDPRGQLGRFTDPA